MSRRKETRDGLAFWLLFEKAERLTHKNYYTLQAEADAAAMPMEQYAAMIVETTPGISDEEAADRQAEGQAIAWAMIYGACNSCAHKDDCDLGDNLPLVETACIQKKAEILNGIMETVNGYRN